MADTESLWICLILYRGFDGTLATYDQAAHKNTAESINAYFNSSIYLLYILH